MLERFVPLGWFWVPLLLNSNATERTSQINSRIVTCEISTVVPVSSSFLISAPMKQCKKGFVMFTAFSEFQLREELGELRKFSFCILSSSLRPSWESFIGSSNKGIGKRGDVVTGDRQQGNMTHNTGHSKSANIILVDKIGVWWTLDWTKLFQTVHGDCGRSQEHFWLVTTLV